MVVWNKLNKNQSGQAALEAAIILIAFVVVASVFAFAILSAGSASTQKGEQAIYSGLQNVQSSMEVKGAVIANGTAGASGADGTVQTIVFTVAPVSGGNPIKLVDVVSGTPPTSPTTVISYRDATVSLSSVPFTVAWITGNSNDLLESGELAEITVTLSGTGFTSLGPNTPFTLEVKPPTGAVIDLARTTPAAIEAVMELR